MPRNLHVLNTMASKTILALLVVILIPTIFISVLFYQSASAIVKHNVRQSSGQIVKQAADSLSNIMNAGSDTSDLLYSDTIVQRTVLLESFPWMKTDTNNPDPAYINNTLNNIIYSNSFVKMVYVLRGNAGSWGSGTFSQIKLNRYKLTDFPWIRQAAAMDGKLTWSYLQVDLFSGAGDNVDLVLPAVRVLKDFQTLNNLGYILVQVDGKAVLNNISKLSLGRTGSFFVVNEDGKMMINRDLNLIGKQLPNPELTKHVLDESTNEFEYKGEGISYYGVKQTLGNGWIMVGVVPIHELTGQLDRLRSSIFKWSFGLFILAIGIGLWSARTITNPIKQLIRQMKLVEEGNLQVRTKINSADEIGLLSKQFNKMIYKVEQLMAQVRNEQSDKQKAELRAITHQINPHFMFNTLTTIRWLIKFGDINKAFEGITNFIRLMEAYMGKKGMMLTLGEELDIMAKYLDILQLRYSLTFTLTTKVDPKTLDFVIPRMFLQPIVENAIFHGIVPSGQNGEIGITVTDHPTSVIIEISDNGLGMDENQLDMLSKLRHKGSFEDVGIGLKHVLECINLYFPSGSSWEFFSKPGEGTTVHLKLMKAAVAVANT